MSPLLSTCPVLPVFPALPVLHRVGRKRTEPSLERAEPVPLVGLDPERGVYQSIPKPRHPVGPLEADGAEPSTGILEKALEMPVAHHAPVGEANAADAEDRAWIALTAWLEITAQPLQLRGDLA